MFGKHEKHSPFFSLMDALKEKHCPICYLCRKSVTMFFDGFLYESVNDPGMRDAIRNAGGFCEKHSWQMIFFGDPFGNAIISHDLLSIVQKDTLLETVKTDRRVKGKCPACQTWEDAEKRYIAVFIENFEDVEFQMGLNGSFGLCLGHFNSILKALPKKQRQRLIEIESAKLSALINELAEFQDKFDYKRSHEDFGEDRDVWIRAVEFLKGRSDSLELK
jgi:hypothetical protein